MKRIFCAVCTLLVAWQAWAGELDDNLKKLEGALQQVPREEVKTPPGAPAAPICIMPEFPIGLLRMHIEQKDYENALQLLAQSGGFQKTEAVRKAVSELIASLRKEQEALKNAAVERVTSALKRAADAVKTAKAPADFDAVIQELGTLKNQQESRGYRSSADFDEAQRLRRQVEGSYRFVASWQEYLAAQASGNADRVRDVLRDLSRQDVFLVPRSEILAKLQEPAPVAKSGDPSLEATAEAFAAKQIAKTQGLEGMGNLLATLRAANDSNRNNRPQGWGDLNRYVQELSEMEHGYREFQAGFPVNTNLFKSIGQAPSALLPLKNQLLLLVLPRFIKAPDALKPKENETVEAYLSRVQEEAKSEGDVDLALRARQAQRRIQQHEYRLNYEIDVINQTQAAKNQEAAGNYALAVISYHNALKTGNDLAPVKWILKRLDEIKKNHPKEYKEGMERVLYQAAPLPELAKSPASEPAKDGQPASTPCPSPSK